MVYDTIEIGAGKRGDRADENASKVIVGSVHAKVIKKIEMKDR